MPGTPTHDPAPDGYPALAGGPVDLAAVDLAAVFAAMPGVDLVLAPDAPRYTMLAATGGRLAATMTTREGTLGRPLFEVFPDANPANAAPSGVGNLQASLDTVLRTRAPHRMAVQRYDLERPDGTWEERYWEPLNVPVLGADGAVRYLLHRVEDVTARVRAEVERARLVAALEAERARLRTLILRMPAAVALHEGPEHRHALVNDAYTRLAGRDPTGQTPREAFPELAGQGIYERFDEVYATGTPWVAPETPLRYDRDGTGVLDDAWMDLRYEPLRDPGVDGTPGPVRAILVFAVDVTAQVRARREVEAALGESERERSALALQAEALREAARLRERTAAAEAARAAAEAANRAKGEFLAVMSHELRTPLNAIGGYAQLLDMGLHGPVTDAQRGALARVQAAQRRLLALVNDVLNYAKLEEGCVEYTLGVVDVRDVVADVAPLLEPQLAAKGLALDLRLPDGPCEVWTDREKLGQVLVNLLSNATKFTEARHPVTGAPGRVTVAVATRRGAAADAVFLRVVDTGRGIPRAKQDAIFEPFVQVRPGAGSAYAQATEGTGLGLAISRDLARGMGGDLRVRSREGEGAAFTVVLRRAAPPDGAARDRRQGAAGTRADRRQRRDRRAAPDRRANGRDDGRPGA